MLSNEQTQGVPATVDTFLLARIVAASLLFSVAIYAGLGFYLVQLAGEKGKVPEIPAVRIVLYVLAVAVQLLSAPMQRLGTCRRENLPAQQLASRPGQHLLSRVVVRMALAEFPAVAGFLLYLMFHELRDFLSLGGLSMGLMVARWPSRDEWLRDAREAAVEAQH